MWLRVCVSCVASQVQSVTPSWVLYVLMQVYFVLLVFGFSIGFTAVTILVNNSAPPRVIGTVNGFSQSAAALTSAVAPAVAGTLFSWSLTVSVSFLVLRVPPGWSADVTADDVIVGWARGR